MRAGELYGKLTDEAIVIAQETGLSYSEVCAKLMTFGVLALAGLIPCKLLPELALGLRRWHGGGVFDVSLREARRRVVEFLISKNGSSAVVRDNSDRAVHALSLILVDDMGSDSEASMSLGNFCQLVWRFERVYENTLNAHV